MSDPQQGSKAALPQSGRLAGVDFGTVRIGIAVSDPAQILASPFENYVRQSEEADARYFRDLAQHEFIVGFVVGLPIHLSGDESPKSAEAREFASWLQRVTDRPIAFCDERYTSVDAERQLVAANLTKKKRKQRLDMLAAQMILRAYLDASPE